MGMCSLPVPRVFCPQSEIGSYVVLVSCIISVHDFMLVSAVSFDFACIIFLVVGHFVPVSHALLVCLDCVLFFKFHPMT